jgi:hypothetical protein
MRLHHVVMVVVQVVFVVVHDNDSSFVPRPSLDSRPLPLTNSLQALGVLSSPPPSFFKLNSPVRAVFLSSLRETV